MALTRIIYASRATETFTEEQLATLVQLSARGNRLRDVTGALVYCDGCFLQMLEGQELVITSLFKHISQDPRHRDVQQLAMRPILQRSFAGWGMSLLHETDIPSSEQAKIGKITSLLSSGPCPAELGDRALQILEELKTVIDRQSNAAGVQRAT